MPRAHPPPEPGVVWVALVSYPDHDDDGWIGDLLLGVFTSRRAAFRALVQCLTDEDGQPLATLRRLTWEHNPHGHVVNAWDDDRWDDPEAARYHFRRARIDELEM